MSRFGCPCGISTLLATTFSTPWISPIPRSASARVRFPSFRANVIGGWNHAVPYTSGTKSLYRASFSTTAEACDPFSPALRTVIDGGTNSMPPNRRVALSAASWSNIPRASHCARV